MTVLEVLFEHLVVLWGLEGGLLVRELVGRVVVRSELVVGPLLGHLLVIAILLQRQGGHVLLNRLWLLDLCVELARHLSLRLALVLRPDLRQLLLFHG